MRRSFIASTLLKQRKTSFQKRIDLQLSLLTAYDGLRIYNLQKTVIVRLRTILNGKKKKKFKHTKHKQSEIKLKK
jgi:hypothetical protein